MRQQLEQTVQFAKSEIQAASGLPELYQLKAKYLGKSSQITDYLKRLRELPQEERPAFGAIVNIAKQEIEVLLEQREQALKELEYQKKQTENLLDLTLPGFTQDRGALHPLTRIWREIEDNFISLGFEVAEGYDVEDQFHNFDALNTPKDHPSRNLADTFFITDNILLRTQTSTVQIRTMERYKPPIRIISPGRCYRNDKLDASHSPVFHQVEALVIDENITFADLRDTLNQFVVKMFGPGTKSRFRPHFFPFTEPSAEMDISCVSCGGTGCRICKGNGWLEMGGAGMVDPNVLEMVGIDPERYTGFAFGLGMDRIAMLKYNLPDIRLLFENDLRFLRQFR